MAAPVGPPHDPTNMFVLPPEPTTGKPRDAQYRRRWRIINSVLLGALLLGVLGGGGYGIWKFTRYYEENVSGQLPGVPRESKEFNYKFIFPPDPPWLLDNETRLRIKANLFALRRSNPNTWMALAAQDFGGKAMPRDSEMIDEAVLRLRDYFPHTFEYERKDNTELAGLKALRLVFQAEDANNVLMSGECFVLPHQGYVYWFYTWGPAQNVKQIYPEFVDLRRRFGVLNYREGWQERRARILTFISDQDLCSVKGPEDLWKKSDRPTDFDELALLALQAADRLYPDRADRRAEALVLLLKGEPDTAPEEVAKNYLLEQQKKDYEATTLEILQDNEGNELAKKGRVGDFPNGHIAKYAVKNTKDRIRFVTLGVVPRGDNIIVVQCECGLDRRSLWETDFDELINSFQLRK